MKEADSMIFQAEYVLDRPYLSECYEESLPFGSFSAVRSYLMGVGFTLLGVVSWQVWEVNGYIASALVTIGVLEVFSTYFKKPWWLFRQKISKSNEAKVTLRLFEDGLSTSSSVHSLSLKWADVAKLQETPRGFIFTASAGSSMYVSKSVLDDRAMAFIKSVTESKCEIEQSQQVD
jgi:hypothetical protein